MNHVGPSDRSEEDYEVYVGRARRRFRLIICGVLGVLIAALFLPQALSPAFLSESTANGCTFFTAPILFAFWQALLTKIRDPADSQDPSAQGQKQHALRLLAVAGACLLEIGVLTGVCFVTHVIGVEGLVGFIVMFLLLACGVGHAFLFRGVKSSLIF